MQSPRAHFGKPVLAQKKYRKPIGKQLSPSDPHKLIVYLTHILTLYLAFYLT